MFLPSKRLSASHCSNSCRVASLSDAVNLRKALPWSTRNHFDALEHITLELQLLAFRRSHAGRLQRRRQHIRRASEIAALTQFGGAGERVRDRRSGSCGRTNDGSKSNIAMASQPCGSAIFVMKHLVE